MAWWLTFDDGYEACVVGKIREALRLSRENRPGHGELVDIRSLPYPGAPRLDDGDEWNLCSTPHRCAGEVRCPKNPVCTE